MSDYLLLDIAKLQVEDYFRLQASAIGFFWLYSTEVFATQRRLFAKLSPELLTDMFYWLFMPQVRVLSRLLSMLLIVPIALLFGLSIDPKLLHGFGPVARQPTWLIVIELVVLMDLATYAIHRAFHGVPWLWRFHALHHSAKYVRWSTTGRVHPVNEAINYLVTVVPLALAGFPVNVILPVSPFVIAFAIGAHTQWNFSFGPLSGIFVSPRFHRWHHTHSHEGGNKNFANVFSFWDRLFGTYYLPADRLPERFGLDVDDVPTSYLGQFLYPWRGKSILSSRPISHTPPIVDDLRRDGEAP